MIIIFYKWNNINGLIVFLINGDTTSIVSITRVNRPSGTRGLSHIGFNISSLRFLVSMDANIRKFKGTIKES